ncbi:hypothetical protein JCM15519_15430 [Fundidesulfovibrio butyratiphilus]
MPDTQSPEPAVRAFNDPEGASHLIPLVVAVTGHRDIDPIHDEKLLSCIKSRLKTIRKQYRHTPIRCLSGLAEGADMIFARAALEMGCELVAVLPGSADHFEKDFDAPAHPHRKPQELRREFRTLLQSCVETFTIPLPPRFEDNQNQYTLVGSYLARHSHLLLALWDGKESSKAGGTRCVMKQFLRGPSRRDRTDPAMLLDAPESRIVHALYVPRKGSGRIENLFQWVVLDKDRARETTAMLRALDTFNAESERLKRSKPELLEQSRQYLGLDEAKVPLHSGEKHILGAFSAADALAGELQRRAHRRMQAIFAAAGLMLLAFNWYSNIASVPVALGAYILFFVAGFSVYAWDKTGGGSTRYIDYRGLAEGLRVLLFYRLAAVPIKASDQYLRKYRSEITWIRDALRTIDLHAARNKPETAIVTKCWIADQAAYFAKRNREDSARKKRLDLAALALFVSGLVLAVAWFALQSEHTAMGDNPGVKVWAITGIGLLPALAALLSGYVFRLGLDQHIKQYARMAAIFQRAADLAGPPPESPGANKTNRPGPDEAQFITLVMELGRESLAENADWMLMHRDRPVTWPQ